jgi:hypothetical protein
MLPIDTRSRSGTKRCGQPSPHGASPAAPALIDATVAPRRAAVAERCATLRGTAA